MNVTLLGLNHDVQWRDPTGDLHRTLNLLFAQSQFDLIGEEASGLPSTVAQRLSCQLNKPWIDIDLTGAERIARGIGESVERWGVIEEGTAMIEVFRYVPEFDEVREEHWLTRLLKWNIKTILCLCGVLHVAPFKTRLESHGVNVENFNICHQEWFVKQYGNYCIVEKDGNRWCEIRRS